MVKSNYVIKVLFLPKVKKKYKTLSKRTCCVERRHIGILNIHCRVIVLIK